MSDDREMTKTKVVSDGNGGYRLKDSAVETLRKWAVPALLGVMVWIGKGAVAELISLHDGQIIMTGKIESIARDSTAAAKSAAEALVQSQNNTAAIARHDEWSKKRSEEIDRAIKAEHDERVKKPKGRDR